MNEVWEDWRLKWSRVKSRSQGKIGVKWSQEVKSSQEGKSGVKWRSGGKARMKSRSQEVKNEWKRQEWIEELKNWRSQEWMKK